VALVEVVGWSTDCTYPETAAQTLRVAYLDATTGAEVASPALDEMPGVDVRVLGWQVDGDAVVAVFRPIEADYPGQALNLSPGVPGRTRCPPAASAFSHCTPAAGTPSWFACRTRRPVSTWPGISWRPTGSADRCRRCRPGSPTGSSRGPAGCCSSRPSSSRSSPTGG